jgi:hypothetical protein
MPKSKPILFADERSLIITNPGPIDFEKGTTTVFVQLSVWINANSLILN